MRWGLSSFPEGMALSIWWLHHQGGRWQEALQPLPAMFGGLSSFDGAVFGFSGWYQHI